jgi:hypothetical protein
VRYVIDTSSSVATPHVKVAATHPTRAADLGATCMTLDNVAAFLPYFTHYLVGTGVSRDTHPFGETQLA